MWPLKGFRTRCHIQPFTYLFISWWRVAINAEPTNQWEQQNVASDAPMGMSTTSWRRQKAMIVWCVNDILQYLLIHLNLLILNKLYASNYSILSFWWRSSWYFICNLILGRPLFGKFGGGACFVLIRFNKSKDKVALKIIIVLLSCNLVRPLIYATA